MNVQTLDTNETVAARESSHWTTCDSLAECRQLLHKKAFRAAHALADHPLFTVDALVGVAREAAKRRGDLYVNAGHVSVNDDPGSLPIPDLPVPEVIKQIETTGAWIVMKHVETNPKYKAILDEWADFVRTIAGPDGAKYLLNPEMLVFITSPYRVTPYHFDAEVNFLVQLHGSKDLWVCDPLDRSLTTEEEIERYYAVSITAGTFKPHTEERAVKFVLNPGDAVHIPTHGGHWVKNHDNISVSLSLNFEFPSRQANIYIANHFLRKAGIKPLPPGQSPIRDSVKAWAIGGAIGARNTLRRVFRR